MSTLDEAQRALSEGDAARVLELFLTVAPADRPRWAMVLLEAGHVEAVQALLPELPPDLHRSLLDLMADEDAVPPPSDDPFDVPDEQLRRRADIDRELVDLFLRFYGGRRDIYAKAWYDERRKRSGYHPVEQPLTADVARAHLQGATTIGQYLLHSDATCSYGVIDLDLSAAVVEGLRAAHGDTVSGLTHAPLHKLVMRMLEASERLHLPIQAEDSGGRGIHLWMHLEPRRPARAVRSVLAQLITAAGPIPPEIQVEIFPKQDRLGPRGLSSLVKLPLGTHPATMRTCVLLDGQLRPIVDPLAALRGIRVAPPDVVDAIAGRRLVTLPAPELQPAGVAPAPVDNPTPRSLAETLRRVEPGLPERDAVERVLLGCPIVATLVRKAFEEHTLLPEEARALLYTIGLIGKGPGLIDEVFASARVPRRELDRLRRGLPNPAGCKKLARFARPGEACGCFAPSEVSPYPTPVLHAVGSIAPAAPRWKAFAEHLRSDESVVQGPLDAIGEALARIESRLDRLERGKDS